MLVAWWILKVLNRHFQQLQLWRCVGLKRLTSTTFCRHANCQVSSLVANIPNRSIIEIVTPTESIVASLKYWAIQRFSRLTKAAIENPRLRCPLLRYRKTLQSNDLLDESRPFIDEIPRRASISSAWIAFLVPSCSSGTVILYMTAVSSGCSIGFGSSCQFTGLVKNVFW